MDGRRNFPQDTGGPDQAARWYQEGRGYGEERGGYGEEREWERRGEPRYGDSYGPESYRTPEPRSAGRGYGDLPPTPAAPTMAPPGPHPPTVGPRTGEPLPPPVSGGVAPVDPAYLLADPPGSPIGEVGGDEASRRRAEAIDRTALRRTGPTDAAGSVYRGRRPGFAALLIVLTVLFELPVLRIFASSVLASKVDAAGTIASIFMMVGLPTFALGLFGLVGSAAAARGSQAWLRAPLAYLPVGLLLFLAAAIAG